eukprot:CAMPEP_0202972872 /NCGR_PEP_ID=MMETSP1396-20130829/43065_1 /ASSEMBLY_ACC=CAM_ASM_000872 /TAXON_ID= /ORGANISM="Pseudokeronopsis sp., Strain Brazil" /LENGTH=45 /DNA_ID= /DNA_START= /DNA_END= /DNA_ORIENTATION=
MRMENNEMEEVMSRFQTLEQTLEKKRSFAAIDKVDCKDKILLANR